MNGEMSSNGGGDTVTGGYHLPTVDNADVTSVLDYQVSSRCCGRSCSPDRAANAE
jgi:hypothetical protein